MDLRRGSILRLLPERGWPHSVVAFLIDPPRWFVAASLAAIAWTGLWLVLRLLSQVVLGDAEDVNKLLLGLAGLLGAPFLVWRTWIANQQQKTGQETHYTNLLRNAIDQLGAVRANDEPNIEHRIGGIYALEKLARDYEPLHWPIMEILCSYVRKQVGILGSSGYGLAAPPVDVQTALTVIGRRSEEQRDWERQRREKTGREERLDLTCCDLSGALMDALHFERADFRGSWLKHASLKKVCLKSALMNGVFLDEVTDLTGANLESAHLIGAHLENAIMGDAKLQGAILNDAHLEGAFLTSATGLTKEQLAQAHGDENTDVPNGLRPERWKP